MILPSTELTFEEACEQFLWSRALHLDLIIEKDSPRYKEDRGTFKNMVQELNLPKTQAGELTDAALNLVGGAIQYAYKHGLKDGTRLIKGIIPE